MTLAKAVIYVSRLGDEVRVGVEGYCCPDEGAVVEYATTLDGREVELSADERAEAEQALLAVVIVNHERARDIAIDARIDAARGK